MLWNYKLSSCLLEPIIFHVFPPKSPDFPHNFPVFPLIFLDKIENLSGKTMFSPIKTEKHKFIRVHSPYFPRFFPFPFLFIPFHSSAWRKKIFSAMSISFFPIFAPVIWQQDDYPSGELQIKKWGMMVLEKMTGKPLRTSSYQRGLFNTQKNAYSIKWQYERKFK